MRAEMFDNLEVIDTFRRQLGKVPHAVNIAFCAFQVTRGCLWTWPTQSSYFGFLNCLPNCWGSFLIWADGHFKTNQNIIFGLWTYLHSNLWIWMLTQIEFGVWLIVFDVRRQLHEICLIKQLTQASLLISLLCNIPSGAVLFEIKK